MHKKENILKDNNGVTMVEFALVSPVFFLIIMGILEFSLIMFASTVMESATNNSSRLGKTGFVAAGTTRQQQIIDNINTRTGGLLEASKVAITTQVYADFSKIGQPEPCITSSPCAGAPGVNFTDVNGNGVWDSDMAQAGLGAAGDTVVYTVSYPWTVFTPIIGSIIGNPFTLTSRSVVRNEPYNIGVAR